MNERIKELIGQVQKEVWGNNPYNGSPEFEGYELDAEKFAELIIRECADLFEVEYGQSKVSGNEVARVLKDHFGVE
jgi:hypothetical protein